jgi:hypothetical protein
LYMWYFSREHVAIYNASQEQIEEQNKLINPPVKLELSLYRPDSYNVHQRWVGLYVHNKSGIHALERCKVTLISFKPKIKGTSQLPSELAWSKNNQPDENNFLVINRDGEAAFDIAVFLVDEDLHTIYLRRGYGIINPSPGKYTFQVRIDGVLNSYDIEPQIYSADMIIEQGKDVDIKNIRNVKNNKSKN